MSIYFYSCLSLYIYIYQSIDLYLYLSINLSYLFVYLYLYLPINLSYVSVYLLWIDIVCLSICSHLFPCLPLPRFPSLPSPHSPRFFFGASTPLTRNCPAPFVTRDLTEPYCARILGSNSFAVVVSVVSDFVVFLSPGVMPTLPWR